MERLELTAAPGDSGRLDAWLTGQCPTLSRSALQNLIGQGLVTCGGAPVNKKDKVAPGKVYAIDLPDPQPIEARPQNIPLDIVYEDDDLLVVNKPKGMVVHPAPGNPDGTLVNALLYHCAGQLSGIGGAIRPGIVHRIDKDTSGLLVVAKNECRPSGAQRPDERTQHPTASTMPWCTVTSRRTRALWKSGSDATRGTARKWPSWPRTRRGPSMPTRAGRCWNAAAISLTLRAN